MGIMDLFRRSKNTKETSLPQTDTERWLTAACAIWSEYCGGSWNYIGGYEKTSANTTVLKNVLNSDWLVTDHSSGIQMVEYSMPKGPYTIAWDLRL